MQGVTARGKVSDDVAHVIENKNCNGVVSGFLSAARKGQEH
jgi:hypothetical protein